MRQTRIVLGSRDTPQFVDKAFFESMQALVAVSSIDRVEHPSSVHYWVPRHFVACPNRDDYDIYKIFVDDEILLPGCQRRSTLAKYKYKYHRPRVGFDRFTVTVSETSDDYFLLLPNAIYENTRIHQNEVSYMCVFDDVRWIVYFRQVHVDPHDLNHSLWFFSHPKYQVELVADTDCRSQVKDLLNLLIPKTLR